MEETAQYFLKTVFIINRSSFLIGHPKFYATHRNYEMLSTSLVPSLDEMRMKLGVANPVPTTPKHISHPVFLLN
jgi:hypothetical protein